MTQSPVFVINPKSHRVNMKGSVLSRIAVDYGDIPIVYFDGSNPLGDALTPLLMDGKDTVYIEGGDGTVVAALTACLESASRGVALPRFAILPGGSTNLTYKKLGLKTVDVDTLKRRLDQRKSNPVHEEFATHMALTVETSETDTPFVGFLMSTGSLARLMLYTQENLHGKTRGVVSIGRAILQLATFPHSTKFSDGLPVVRPSQFSVLGEADEMAEDEQAFSIFSTFRELSLDISPFWARGDAPIGYTKPAWPIHQLRVGIAKALLGGAKTGLENHGLSSEGCAAMTFKTEGPILLDGEELPMPKDQTYTVAISPPLEFIR